VKMYTGNGVTTDFPLPEGADGSTVWLTPPEKESIRMEQGAAYTVTDGAARFVIPPPQGWIVSFHEPAGGAVMTEGYVVAHSDGTLEVVSEDPAELVAQARALLEAAKREREETAALLNRRGAEIRALADEAKATLESRLLNYGARAEEAITAAASAARLDIVEKLSGALDEIKAGQKGVAAAQMEIRAAQTAILNSAQTAADEAAEEARCQVHDLCASAIEAWNKIKAVKAEMEVSVNAARQAADKAGDIVRREMTARCEAMLEEIRGVRGRLERDVIREADREERRRNEAVNDMRRVRDEMDRTIERASYFARPQQESEGGEPVTTRRRRRHRNAAQQTETNREGE